MYSISAFLLTLPPYFIPAVAFLFGVIIGSFLNVYIYRFNNRKSIAGSSHCLSCQTPLKFYELFPLLSYLGLRGRCRSCSAHIPARYFWVELGTAVLFLLTVLTTADFLLWPLLFVLMSVLMVVSVYDLYHFVIPDVFVWTLGGIAFVYGGYVWYMTGDSWQVLESALASLCAFGFFAGLWAYSEGRWIGFGDAKLAIPLAFIVGIGGVFSMLVLSFWIGTIISLGIILWQRYGRRGQFRLQLSGRPLTIKSEVPFAPFMILGFLAVLFFHADVLTLFSYVLL